MVKGVLGIVAALVALGLLWWLLCAPEAPPVAEPVTGDVSPGDAAAVAPPETLAELAERTEEVAVRETERATVVELSDVLFDFDRAEIRPDGEPALRALVAFLKEDPQRRVRINGHADSVGGEEYNRELSERRAEVVRRYLVAQEIAPGRLTVRAFGESLPVAPNATARGRQLNRRVELSIERRPRGATGLGADEPSEDALADPSR